MESGSVPPHRLCAGPRTRKPAGRSGPFRPDTGGWRPSWRGARSVVTEEGRVGGCRFESCLAQRCSRCVPLVVWPSSPPFWRGRFRGFFFWRRGRKHGSALAKHVCPSAGSSPGSAEDHSQDVMICRVGPKSNEGKHAGRHCLILWGRISEAVAVLLLLALHRRGFCWYDKTEPVSTRQWWWSGTRQTSISRHRVLILVLTSKSAALKGFETHCKYYVLMQINEFLFTIHQTTTALHII